MNTQRKFPITEGMFNALVFAILVLQIYPVFWVIASSFKRIEEFRTKLPFSMPESFYLDNYVNALVKSNIGVYFKNSSILLVLVVIGILVLSSMAAFAIQKLRFKHNKNVLTFFLLGLMVPIQVTLIPLYQIYSRLHILNSYFGLMLPQVGFGLPVSIYLFTAFYSYLPNEVIESAMIDGASVYKVFTSIILPMSKNTIITVATLFGVFTWNEFIFTYTFTNSKDMLTITIGLRDFIGKYGLTDWGATFATMTLTIVPTFILYFLLSKNIIEGMTAGAIKS
jgi:raffinose/stachyose/melibiose transport system permease protein